MKADTRVPEPSEFRCVVVGSGFYGATVAHLVATELRIPVLVIEKRAHVGGNSYSELDPHSGIEIHRYGSHLFHTSNRKVWQFVNKFSEFTSYRHRVFSRHKGRMFTMPINLMTINNFFGLDLTPAQAENHIRTLAAAENIAAPANLEEQAISQIGRDLYEAFVKHYTQKQWETAPGQLPASIIKRLPVRFNYNDFYFSDHYEGLPVDGYHKIFERMLEDPLIHIELGCDFFQIREKLDPNALIIFTGPIDRYFDYRFGPLTWRTLDFEVEHLPVTDFQGAAVVNYPDPDVRYTRIHEFKHLHPERPVVPDKTVIMREYSRFAKTSDLPYYPIATREDNERLSLYQQAAAAEQRVLFGGRLGSYLYLDMHQAIAAAMKCFHQDVAPRLTNSRHPGQVSRIEA